MSVGCQCPRHLPSCMLHLRFGFCWPLCAVRCLAETLVLVTSCVSRLLVLVDRAQCAQWRQAVVWRTCVSADWLCERAGAACCCRWSSEHAGDCETALRDSARWYIMFSVLLMLLVMLTVMTMMVEVDWCWWWWWWSYSDDVTRTHTFKGPLSRTTRVSRYQKSKTNLDFTEARDSEGQWHQLGHMQVCTSLQTDNHASTPPLSFLQAWCPSCHPTYSVEALKAKQ